MAEFPAMPLWTDAYLSDTRHLTAAQHGAYLLLLITAWRSRDCTLPDDDILLARWACMDQRTFQRNKLTILSFWELRDGRWCQAKLLDVRQDVADKVNQKSAAGHSSALKRKETRQRALQREVNGKSTNENENETIDTNVSIDTHTQEEKKRGSAKHELPKDFMPDADSIRVCDELNVSVEEAIGNLRDWAAAKRPKYYDWQATFRNSVKRAAKFGQGNKQSNAFRQKPASVIDAALRVAARYQTQA